MKEHLSLLIELQKIDSAILEKRNIIGITPSKVSQVEQPLKNARSLYDKHKQKCESFEKKRKEKERQLEDINEKVKKLKSRISEIKTNKEYQAHLKEIESVEKERYAIEDEILSVMEMLDAASVEMKAEEAKVKSEKEKIEAFRKKLDEEVAEAEKELSELKHGRAGIVGALDGDTYNQYMIILESGKGLAVAEVRDEICQGCNMNIPPQLFVEIKKNEEIIQCPQCRRILYWEEKND